VVTGNPGIGKTYFLLYCLRRFSHLDIPVLYQNISTNSLYLITADGEIRFFSEDEDEVPDTAVFLINSGDSTQLNSLNENVVAKCPFTIMASSPQFAHYAPLAKRYRANFLFMPTWEWTELECLATQFSTISTDQLKELYERYDGIPRYCFDYKMRPDLDSAMANSPANSLLSSFMESKSVNIEITHQLIKIVPTVDFSGFTHVFLSKYVVEYLPEILAKREKDAVVTLVTQSLVSIPTAQSLRGCLFESLAHVKLASGDTFTSNNGDHKFMIPHVDIKLQPKQDSFEKYLEKINETPRNTYIRFARKNFALIDSLYWPDGNIIIGFQMTVSKDHSFNIELADDLLDRLDVEILTEDSAVFHIYYVLPADAYDNFKCPDPKSVDGRVHCFKLKISSY